MFLQLEQLAKSFGDTVVLRDVTLGIEAAEIVVLLGPSGCGKTTLLRIIAGLEQPDAGRVVLSGQDLAGTPVHERGFGMVSQEFTLFPHRDVAGNVAFGLRMQGWARERRHHRVHTILELVGLEGFGKRDVHSLSGGEQQRVALARSLAPSPRVLLLDEPLGSLDRALRERLMTEIRNILKQAGEVTGRKTGITSIYVTHDQEEAFAIADRVVVMSPGRIEQVGKPWELYGRPRNRFVANFLGMSNLVRAKLLRGEPPMAVTPLGKLRIAQRPAGTEQDVTLLVRPDAGRLVAEDSEQDNVVRARLEDVSFRGEHQIATFLVKLDDGDSRLSLHLPSTTSLPTESEYVTIALNPAGVLVLE